MSDEEIVDRWLSDVHKVTESTAERTHYFHAQIGVTLAREHIEDLLPKGGSK